MSNTLPAEAAVSKAAGKSTRPLARKKQTRPTAAQLRRRIRTAILQRWDQLADDLYHLEQDIRNAPRGTFTEDESHEAIHELSQTAWDVMVNSRPRLPASESREPSVRMRAALRNRDLASEMTDEEIVGLLKAASAEKMRRWLYGLPVSKPKGEEGTNAEGAK